MHERYRKYIPAHARCVHAGTVFQTYTWEQSLYSGKQVMFDAVTRTPSALTIPVLGDTILLQKERNPHREDPFISLPGGHMEVNDATLKETAKRELLEETGYRAGELELFFDNLNETPVLNYIHDFQIFIARDISYMQPPEHDHGEQIEHIEVSFDEFLTCIGEKQFRVIQLARAIHPYLVAERGKDSLHTLLFPN